MKIRLLFVFSIVFLTSCSSSVLVTNKTNDPIEIITILNKNEQADFKLTYRGIKDRNVLKEKLKPDESIQIIKKGYSSLVAISDYDYYLKNDLKQKKLNIDKSIYHSSPLVTEVGVEPEIVNLQIKNQSKHTIKQVKLDMGYGEIENVMECWNLIFPSNKGEIKYEYYGRTPSNLKTVVIIGELEGEVLRKEYTKNLTDLIIFE